ncbi:Nramp family divalent metal transporter [Pirellulales bacterium]|nr:Nramp family divalent metal transporter [Pirellulales bacterium]
MPGMANPDHDTLRASLDPRSREGIEEPPRTLWGILKRCGPGMIVAGAIVGSGELIATTKSGAQAGVCLLWLIIVGCVIKVFVQIEIGRYTVSHGETPLAALDQIPGPRIRVNWIIWYWLILMIALLGALGGIVGGVGQSLALTFPITGDYARTIQVPSQAELTAFLTHESTGGNGAAEGSTGEEARLARGREILRARIEKLGDDGQAALAAVAEFVAAQERLEEGFERGAARESAEKLRSDVAAAEASVKQLTAPYTKDDRIWALAATLITIGLLIRGRYRMIETLSLVLVVSFTFVTVGNVIALQLRPEFALSAADYLQGLSLQLPAGPEGLATAIATFGIIGVGASELLIYPYWCLEKGYAKFTGPRSRDDDWGRRARGWMTVMHYDALIAMALYTIATLAFFLMGVAVLHQQGLDPDGMRMVSTLLEQYVPVFGDHARWVFLSGAIAVLYSTFLVAMASFARMYADGLKIYGLLDPHDQRLHDRAITAFSVLLPLISFGVYCFPGANPVALVLLAGTMEGVMLPMLAFAALYFRYCKTDSRLAPGRLWDLLLILSCIGMFIAGTYSAYSSLTS